MKEESKRVTVSKLPMDQTNDRNLIPKHSKNNSLFTTSTDRNSSIVDFYQSGDTSQQNMSMISNLDEEKSTNQSSSSINDHRKPPEEEFFHMLLMTYKLLHPHMNNICDINSKKMFKRFVDQKKL